jgi:hypothetical protein
MLTTQLKLIFNWKIKLLIAWIQGLPLIYARFIWNYKNVPSRHTLHILRASVKDTLYSCHHGVQKIYVTSNNPWCIWQFMHKKISWVCKPRSLQARAQSLRAAKPPGLSVEPPCSAYLEYFQQNRRHHIYKQTPHISNMLETYEYKKVLPQF